MGRSLWFQGRSRWADVWGGATVVADVVVGDVGVAAEESAVVVVLAVVRL